MAPWMLSPWEREHRGKGEDGGEDEHEDEDEDEDETDDAVETRLEILPCFLPSRLSGLQASNSHIRRQTALQETHPQRVRWGYQLRHLVVR